MRIPAAFRDATLLRKLMVVAVVATAGATLFALLIMVVQQWFLQRGELVKSLYAQASIVAINSSSALLFDDYKTAEQTLSALAVIDNIEYAVIIDKRGENFANYARSGGPIAIHRHPDSDGGDAIYTMNHLEVVVPIVFKRETIGAIHVMSDLKPVYERLMWSMLATVVASMGALFAAVMLLRRLLPVITDPLQYLVGLMKAVSRDKNYALRAALQSGDVFGTLAQGFNDMLAQMQIRDDVLELHRAHLEDEVVKRTARLTDAQKLTRQIIETIPLRVFWKDRDSRYLGCNSLFAKDAGLRMPDELTGKTDFDMGWRNQAELYRTDDRRVMDSNRARLSYDEPQTTPAGEFIWLRTSKVPLHNDNDETIGLLGIYEDITEYKQMELRLLESEERFRKAFQYSAIGMALVGLDGHWLKVNDALCRIVGYSKQELLDKTFRDITHPDDLQTDIDFVNQLLAGELDHYQMEKRYYHKDGHVIWIRLSVSLIRDAQDNPIHFVSQLDDITEQKQAAEYVRQLNDELESRVQERTRQLLLTQGELVRNEKLAMLGQVAGSVGHELRNPLSVMNNAVYFLQTVLSDADETTLEYLNIIKSEIASSERIVSDLLDSVRITTPHPETVGVAELIGLALRKLEIPNQVSVKLEIPATMSPLQVDAMQIHHALRNLIGNAVEAMPKGGTLKISANEDLQAGHIRLSVSDSGIGMTPEQQSHLFQPLFTTKARGIGLGLVVVKNFILANGGSIDVQSEYGHGTTFSVTLPCGKLTPNDMGVDNENSGG
jgi:PAS domain S-box-containing protein